MEKLACADNTLSYQQKTQLDPNLHNSGISVRLANGADTRVLAQSLSALVLRHEFLWTRFYGTDGQILREIMPTAEVPLTMVHAEDWSADDVEEDIVAQTVVPFDLGQGPALRASLHVLAGGYALAIQIPHLICDQISPELLFNDLCAIYDHLSRPDGNEAALSQPEQAYAGHVA